MARIQVRARAVDMLGRQQIAGIPTAIHELFKNAHDAYARRVEVDYYRSKSLLILRDDGFGMTQEDFEDHWLTLGTESKLGTNEVRADWLGEFASRPRHVLGEKGIGRLAIAAIGPQVLVMTRAIREDGLHDLVISLIHWGLFELPGVDLADIQIPVRTVSEGAFPDEKLVVELADEIRANLHDLGAKVAVDAADGILQDLDRITIDPMKFDHFLGEPSLRGDGYGTHFYILPVDPILDSDIDISEEDIASPLLRNLLGFSSSTFTKSETVPINARFRDHRRDSTIEELIGENTFFTADEFCSADHHFEGNFDEFGQFSGTVSVYGGESLPHLISWKGDGQKTACGPFSIKFAYVQGLQHESRIPPEEFSLITKKLDRIGGLYIYRDGIRILPYGNSDFDFLNIERRRNKAAKDWFFSYRRIFGAVAISHKSNPHLHEKAGREGFIANKAYRQMKGILENFFKSLAIDYFRRSGNLSGVFWGVKDEAESQRESLKKQEKRAKVRKQRFEKSLDDFFSRINSAEPSRRSEEMEQSVENRLDRIRQLNDPTEVGNAVLNLEADVRRQKNELRNSFKITRPSGVSLTKAQKEDWSAYQNHRNELEAAVFQPVDERIDAKLSEFLRTHKASIDQRRRIQQAVLDLSSTSKKETRSNRQKADASVQEVQQVAQASIHSAVKKLDQGLQEILIQFERTDTSDLGDQAMTELRRNLEQRIVCIAEEENDFLEELCSQMVNLAEALKEGDTLDAITTAVSDKAADLEAELEKYSEWAQTGMAIGIVQHEFGATVKQLRRAIRQLKPWADGTPDLKVVHNDLTASFEHLDGYLGLFAPLNRRLYRKRIDLSGKEIRRYLITVFGERLERHNIKLSASQNFDQSTTHIFPSTLLPVFINVLDNAIHWITSDNEGEHWIRLDTQDQALLVSNSGPGIEQRYAHRIFEFGESFKSGYGRGMGLYISRQSLHREGWDITLDNPGTERHPVFRMAPMEDYEDDKG